MLEILFEDQELVVINKPAGLLVHKTVLAFGEEENALIQLRDQIGSWVAPVHRLDRATSGCLLFAKNEQKYLFKQAHENVFYNVTGANKIQLDS